MYVEDSPRQPWRERFGASLERIEAIYLRMLRAVILLMATGLIAIAAWLAISGLYKISRSPDSVETAQASVAANEIIELPSTLEQPASNPSDPKKIVPSASVREAYAKRRNDYFSIYRSQFEAFRQPDDKQLSPGQFDDKYLGTAARAQEVAEGTRGLEADLADLDTLIATMREAANLDETRTRLRNYKAARKVDVRRTVERTRTEYQRGWDSGSTDCAGWYQYPVGCAVMRPVTVPYKETVTAKEFPKGTVSHAALFDAYHTKYLELLDRRRADAEEAAENERSNILSGQIAGGVSLWSALQIFGGFLALMFFFLLIAIERHQRRQAQAIASGAQTRA